MVRPTAPSAAKLKTDVVKDGQELLNTESFFLVYSSTKASWENENRRKKLEVKGETLKIKINIILNDVICYIFLQCHKNVTRQPKRALELLFIKKSKFYEYAN